MGILESCEGMDTRMSVSLDNNLFRQYSIPKYSVNDLYFQQSRLKLLGDIFYKKIQGKTEFILQTSIVNRNPQVINHALKIYDDSNQFISEKGNKIKIINCIEDPNSIGSQLFIIKMTDKPNQMLLKLIPFNRFEQQKFKKGLYEISMLHKNLKQQNSRFVYTYQDAFVIQSGIDKDFNDKCLVIIGDFCNATLNELIMYRKIAQLNWTQNKFQKLCCQLIRGLLQVHKKNIAHRDIRPHNIYYSYAKKTYLIGGFHNAIYIDKNKTNPSIGYNLSGVPYYLPKYLTDIAKKQDYSEYYNYDPFKNDIYSLGLTLLNALFSDMFMPIQILTQSLKKYENRYSYLSILKSMVSSNPPSLEYLLQALQESSESLIDQKANIEALRFKMKPQDQQFVNRKKMIANGYYQMFMYDEWMQEINEVVNYYELNGDNLQLAEMYKKIADIYSEHHQQQMMSEYYSKASNIYLKISSDCLEEKKNQQSIKYLQKGIQCNRKGYSGFPNTDLAYLLNKLAMAHHDKAEYQVARAFQQESLQIISRVHGQNSVQYAQMLIDSAKIESEFQQFKQAQNMLKTGLKIIGKKQESAENSRIRAKLLESLGNNFRMKAIQRRDKCQQYRRKAEEHLLDALQLIQKNQGSIHPQVGSILLNLGNVYFDRRQFDKAKKSYQKSLIVKQHTLKGRYNVEVGECLTYLGNSEKCLKEYDKSIKHYDQAIEVFRKAYGNDHNENTAVAIGNLGLVYKQMGKIKQQKQYLSLAKSILKDLYGQQCPDYQYFDRQMSK